MSFLAQFISMGMGLSGSSAGLSADFEDDVTSTLTTTATSTATSFIEPITTIMSGIGSFFEILLQERNGNIERISSGVTDTFTTFTTLTTETVFSPSIQEDENSSSSIPLSYILGATSLLALSSILLFLAVRKREKKLEEGETYKCEPYNNHNYTQNPNFTEVYLEPQIQPIYDITHPSSDNLTYTYQKPLYDLEGI